MTETLVDSQVIQKYLDILPAMRAAARRKGYALGVHGSLRRDMDVIAVPWVDEVSPPEELAESIRQAVNGYIESGRPGRDPEIKPHGRLAWSIHLGGSRYIDLSVLPAIAHCTYLVNEAEELRFIVSGLLAQFEQVPAGEKEIVDWARAKFSRWAGVVSPINPIGQGRESVLKANSDYKLTIGDQVAQTDQRANTRDAIEVLNRTRERLAEAENVLRKVQNWADAYPLDVFPEPDLAHCARLLQEGGESMDNLAAYARRGAIEWIGHDIRAHFAKHSKKGTTE